MHSGFGALSTNPSWQSAGAQPTQSELGAPSASQLGKASGDTTGPSRDWDLVPLPEGPRGPEEGPVATVSVLGCPLQGRRERPNQPHQARDQDQDTPGHPIKNRIRPLNPTLEADLRKQIDKWQSEGVIEPSMSPWNFGLDAAPKKSGTIR
jgi:hypothetical protein